MTESAPARAAKAYLSDVWSALRKQSVTAIAGWVATFLGGAALVIFPAIVAGVAELALCGLLWLMTPHATPGWLLSALAIGSGVACVQSAVWVTGKVRERRKEPDTVTVRFGPPFDLEWEIGVNHLKRRFHQELHKASDSEIDRTILGPVHVSPTCHAEAIIFRTAEPSVDARCPGCGNPILPPNLAAGAPIPLRKLKRWVLAEAMKQYRRRKGEVPGNVTLQW